MRVEGQGSQEGPQDEQGGGGGSKEDLQDKQGGGSKEYSQHGGGGPGLDQAQTDGEPKVRLACVLLFGFVEYAPSLKYDIILLFLQLLCVLLWLCVLVFLLDVCVQGLHDRNVEPVDGHVEAFDLQRVSDVEELCRSRTRRLLARRRT